MCPVQKHTTQGNKTQGEGGSSADFPNQPSQRGTRYSNHGAMDAAEKRGKLRGGQRRPVPFDIKQGRVVLQLSGLQDGFLLSSVVF